MNSHLYLLLLAATAPVIIGLWYIFAKDRYNKEPAHMLLGAFLLGVVSIIPVGIIEFILIGIGSLVVPENSHLLSSAWSAFIVAAITEECFKLFFLYAFVWNSPEFDERFDGIVYGVFVSLGFACAENILYIFGFLFSEGVAAAYTTSLMRAIFSIPCHFFCGVILGYYLSLAKFERVHTTSPDAQGFAVIKGLFIAILFHGFYDFIVFYFSSFSNAPNESSFDLKTTVASAIFINVFLVFNILFWKHCYKRINHMASLLRPNPVDEQSALITCSHCGTTYMSDLYACPNCKQTTYSSALAENNSSNGWTNQDLHNLNRFPSNHEAEPPQRNPHDI